MEERNPVRRITLIVLAVCLFLFVWSLVADRLTPSTDQADIRGVVVPIASIVVGIVKKDAVLAFPEATDAFNSVLDMKISEKNTPHLYMILRRSLADAGLSTYAAKNHYQRKRPLLHLVDLF